jgi:hypothetical protein
MVISCIHTPYSWRAHLFLDDCPLWMQFYKWLQQHTVDVLFSHNILWTERARFTCEGVFNVDSSHLWAQNSHAIHECGYQVHFIITVWVGIIRNIVMGPFLLLLNNIVIFWKLYCWGCMDICLELWDKGRGFTMAELLLLPTVVKMSGNGWMQLTEEGGLDIGSFAWASLVTGSD